LWAHLILFPHFNLISEQEKKNGTNDRELAHEESQKGPFEGEKDIKETPKTFRKL